ncbi:MAG: KOW domain-containing RNA-binding protein [Bacillota bacterium]
MGDLQVGDVVRSAAGRDEGEPYVVVGFSDGRVLLSEGRKKTLRRPKSKNRRHVVWVGRVDEALASRIECRRSRDEDIAEFVGIYRRNGNYSNQDTAENAGHARDSEGAGL